jgi:serine/threonine protein kinase
MAQSIQPVLQYLSGILPGTTLQNGRYTLEVELGSGGVGVAFRAKCNATQQTVVIKTLNATARQHTHFAELKRKFEDEAHRLETCLHPNIVRFNDYFVEGELPYLVMEYLPGQTLAALTIPEQKPISEATALHYIRQIGAALNVVHQHGLLHRDVKPDNIILKDGTDQVILIDFGIAREFVPGLFQTHTQMLSHGYAPVEQYLLQGKRTAATDVYGLAATLYTLLTGRVPIASVLRDREPMATPRELLPFLSTAVDQAVMQGMAIEINDRPQSIDAWLALLPGADALPMLHFATQQQVVTIEQSISWVGRIPPLVRRWLGLGIGAIALVGTSVYWGLAGQNQSGPTLSRQTNSSTRSPSQSPVSAGQSTAGSPAQGGLSTQALSAERNQSRATTTAPPPPDAKIALPPLPQSSSIAPLLSSSPSTSASTSQSLRSSSTPSPYLSSLRATPPTASPARSPLPQPVDTVPPRAVTSKSSAPRRPVSKPTSPPAPYTLPSGSVVVLPPKQTTKGQTLPKTPKTKAVVKPRSSYPQRTVTRAPSRSPTRSQSTTRTAPRTSIRLPSSTRRSLPPVTTPRIRTATTRVTRPSPSHWANRKKVLSARDQGGELNRFERLQRDFKTSGTEVR